MQNVADIIERFIISELFDDQKEFINVQRTELAQQLSCAPSQITYALTTRFTPEKGYEVVSKRGNGGFIRVIRLNAPVKPKLSLPANTSAEDMVKVLESRKMISKRESKLLNYNLELLGDHVSPEEKCVYVHKAYERMTEGE